MTYRAAMDKETFCECAIRSSQYVDRDIFGKWEACTDCQRPIEGSYRTVNKDDSKSFNI